MNVPICSISGNNIDILVPSPKLAATSEQGEGFLLELAFIDYNHRPWPCTWLLAGTSTYRPTTGRHYQH